MAKSKKIIVCEYNFFVLFKTENQSFGLDKSIFSNIYFNKSSFEKLHREKILKTFKKFVKTLA
jgi:hypothetical protein